MRGRKPYIGTENERQQVQIRIKIDEVQEVKDQDYFGFGDMSKFILSLWSKEIKRQRKKRAKERV